MIFAIVLIAIGGLIILQYFNVITGDIWPLFWGILLLLFGLVGLLKKGHHGFSCCGSSKKE